MEHVTRKGQIYMSPDDVKEKSEIQFNYYIYGFKLHYKHI